ncbi:hypothetical protein [Streptomyces flavofungini]|uniref:hypothetical protein n=1 Tax=Streptomyces flavofungini TaxID=68200 RepID=UPI0025B09BFC|nr:hypothetical protein [Streptomyces flavofungini]WJV49202.1 hypothetical protein QUY26_29055 [Streptomyces flavofungini]
MFTLGGTISAQGGDHARLSGARTLPRPPPRPRPAWTSSCTTSADPGCRGLGVLTVLADEIRLRAG